MNRISIIGGGNVAWHLSQIISKTKELQLVQIINRSIKSIESFQKFAEITANFNEIKSTDIFIICVSDQAIAEVSAKLPKDILQVHTSGSVSMEVLHGNRKGVFYPLQTFNKNSEVNVTDIPILLESNTKRDETFLFTIAQLLSQNVSFVNSENRLKIHIAAVYVNNFVNHLNYLAFNFLEKNKLNPKLLLPLIRETALKLQHINPYDAQTGPAKRNDVSSINTHLINIKDLKLESIYKTLTQSIIETYEEKL